MGLPVEIFGSFAKATSTVTNKLPKYVIQKRNQTIFLSFSTANLIHRWFLICALTYYLYLIHILCLVIVILLKWSSDFYANLSFDAANWKEIKPIWSCTKCTKTVTIIINWQQFVCPIYYKDLIHFVSCRLKFCLAAIVQNRAKLWERLILYI